MVREIVATPDVVARIGEGVLWIPADLCSEANQQHRGTIAPLPSNVTRPRSSTLWGSQERLREDSAEINLYINESTTTYITIYKCESVIVITTIIHPQFINVHRVYYTTLKHPIALKSMSVSNYI